MFSFLTKGERYGRRGFFCVCVFIFLLPLLLLFDVTVKEYDAWNRGCRFVILS